MRIIPSSLADVQKLKRRGIIDNIFKDINFTMESEKDAEQAFLNVLVKRYVKGTLEKRVYLKQTHTNQIINFRNNHPNIHKR